MGWIAGLLVVLAPTGGAGFVWMFERHVPSFRQHLPDRVTKLIYSSLIFAVVLGCPIYYAYTYVDTYYLQLNRRLPGWVWIGLMVAVALPPTLGEIIGSYWEKIGNTWESIRRKLFRYRSNGERWRPDIPTAFDYVIRLLMKERSLFPIVMIHYTNTGAVPYVVVGHLGHASGTPNPQDIYLSTVYFYGPEEKFIDPGTTLKIQEGGCLINYKDVTYTRVLFSISNQNQQEGSESCLQVQANNDLPGAAVEGLSSTGAAQTASHLVR